MRIGYPYAHMHHNGDGTAGHSSHLQKAYVRTPVYLTVAYIYAYLTVAYIHVRTNTLCV